MYVLSCIQLSYTRAICDLTCLTYLEINECFGARRVTEDVLCALSNLVNLRTLEVNNVEEFSDHALSSLGALVNLESLSIDNTGITGTGFRNLFGLTVLHTLEIVDCLYLSDEGILECVRALKALRYLALIEGAPDIDPQDILTSAV